MRVYLKGLVVLLALGFGVAQAQSVNNILDAGERNIRLAQASQDRVDKIVEQERELVDQYNTINKEVDGLKVYNSLMDRQIQNQVEEMAKLAQSIDQVTVMERQIMPLMLRMIDGLEQFISLDIPFLEEERTNRVEKLRDLMERSDVSVAEKFRNVFEAFSIENDYGRTISTYKGALTIVSTDGSGICKLPLASINSSFKPDHGGPFAGAAFFCPGLLATRYRSAMDREVFFPTL